MYRFGKARRLVTSPYLIKCGDIYDPGRPKFTGFLFFWGFFCGGAGKSGQAVTFFLVFFLIYVKINLCINIGILIHHYFTHFEFFTSVLTDGFSLKFRLICHKNQPTSHH